MTSIIMILGLSLTVLALEQTFESGGRSAPADLVFPTPGAPLSADQVEEFTRNLPDGTSAAEVTTSKIYRDSKGRLRVESKLQGSSEQPTEIFLLDPTTGSRVILIVRNKQGIRLAGPKSGQTGFPLGFAGIGEALPAGNWRVSTENLGRRVMEGLQVEGSRTAHINEHDSSPMRTEERWYSKDLNLTVLAVVSGRNGTHTARLQKLAFGEPDPALFSIPSEYSVQDVQPSER